MIEIENVSAVARWFPDDVKVIKRKTKFKAVCSIFHLQPSHVFIYAMHGELTKKDMVELFEELSARGVTHVSAERKGRIVMKDIQLLLERNRADVVLEKNDEHDS